jgi:uncharacterized protein
MTAALEVVLLAALAATPAAKRDYPVRPVPFTDVTIADSFWAPRIETNRTRTIPALFKMSEDTGRIDNFMIAAGLKPGKFVGQRYNDSDVYKSMQAAADSLAVHPDPKLDAYLDKLISYIAAAQEPDGYLYTPRTIDPKNPPPHTGATRFSLLEDSHELYDVGHMYEAAVAHFQATGKRSFLNVAIKSADLICRTFGPEPGQHPGVPGHEEIEIGLVKLYRVTGDEKYLKQAKYFLEERGDSKRRKLYTYGGNVTYAQDNLPVLDQPQAVGHAVRALYLYSAMTDVAALTGDPRYPKALDRMWHDIVDRKIYVTGGVGASGDDEAIGTAYDLPNLTAYSETCAAVANVLWNQRLFQLTGQARYLDVLERTLYNALLAGVSFSGDRFFYDNPLASCGRHERKPWFDCSCCPPNVARTLASLSGYIYAVKDKDLYVDLYIGSRGSASVAGTKVGLRLETDYPWDGTVRLQIDPERESEFRLRLRVPSWASGHPLPGDLYTFADESREAPLLLVNGKGVTLRVEDGFAGVERRWKKGDQVQLVLPMPVRKLLANPAVAADRGRIALQRGPLVYAAEAVDNGGHTSGLVLGRNARLEKLYRPELFGGIETLLAPAQVVSQDPTSLRLASSATRLVAVPYYAWDHRGAGDMTVWFATDASEVPPPTLTREVFGKTPDGKEVWLYTIANRNGYRVRLTNYGGRVVSIEAPDRDGRRGDVVLGYDTLAEYIKGNPYFGALIGRYGNRIAKGRFSLDGHEYQLPTNDGPNHLHGGPGGFHTRVFDSSEIDEDDARGVELRYVSPDGEEGYPGTLHVTVRYTLNDRNELGIEYEATTDKPTIVNLTHHSFFNLHGAGDGDVLAERLQILADKFTPVDATLIPTGELRDVAGTPFDFRTPHAIGERIGEDDPQLKYGHGYDHNFVLRPAKDGELRLAAVVVDPNSGRKLEILTTEPGLQFYSGNFLDGSDKGKGGKSYAFRSAFCLEPQHYPDSPNHPEFPSTLLRPGERYHTRSVYRFSVE